MSFLEHRGLVGDVFLSKVIYYCYFMPSMKYRLHHLLHMTIFINSSVHFCPGVFTTCYMYLCLTTDIQMVVSYGKIKTKHHYWANLYKCNFQLSVKRKLGFLWFFFTWLCDWSLKLSSHSQPIGCWYYLVLVTWPIIKMWSMMFKVLSYEAPPFKGILAVIVASV